MSRIRLPTLLCYERQRQELLKRRGALQVDHPESVVTTFTLSFEKVLEASRAAADLLRLCAFLHPDDIPLVRRARRASISRCNHHALSDYASFTKILWALTWKPELVKR